MIKFITYNCPPLLCWDAIALGHHHQSLTLMKRKEVNDLETFALKYQWNTDLSGLLEKDYDALVLTDKNAVIKWVNDGFFSMTGYSKSFSVGKRPDFLQGEKTIRPTINKILTDLDNNSSFSSTVVNYRRNKEAYVCNIEIFPLFNKDEKLSHLLAVEKELSLTATV